MSCLRSHRAKRWRNSGWKHYPTKRLRGEEFKLVGLVVAIIDWASRAVLAWRLSNTNDASFCAAALEEALLRFGKPRIFNTDQGSTFTAEAFAGKLAAAGVAISMDGRGRFMDNIFIERLWRSIKYEEVHLKACADGREARAGIGSWMTFLQFSTPSPR